MDDPSVTGGTAWRVWPRWWSAFSNPSWGAPWRLGTGRLAWPWWIVIVGTRALAASDTAYSVASALGTYGAGSGWIDNGWMVAHVLIALGALVARDVAKA